MAYVPPHKRHNKDKERPSPSPELPPPRHAHFHNKQNPKTNPSTYSHAQSPSPSSSKIIYSKSATSKWFLVGYDYDHDHDNQLPPFLQFHPVSLESAERKFGQKPLILVDTETHMDQPQGAQARRSPWEVVAAKVLQDLISSFENVRTEMEAQNPELELVKPVLVARFGKVLFHGGPSATQEAIGGNLASRTMLKQLRRMFYTDIPTSYMEKMKTGLPLELGLELDYVEKDVYHVKLSDANQPEAKISCKCSILREQNKLQLYKIELNQVRQMVMDVSCINKNLDLRLMLSTKKILTTLKDDEMQCIQNLIESAVLDPNVKGGLRWPLGKASSGDRFSVVGVWHTITKAYKNLSLRLKVRYADRFDFQTSEGESSSEVYLILKRIVSGFQVQKVDAALVSKMLEDTLEFIWDHFLDCDLFLG